MFNDLLNKHPFGLKIVRICVVLVKLKNFDSHALNSDAFTLYLVKIVKRFENLEHF